MKLGKCILMLGMLLPLSVVAGGISSGTFPGFVVESWGGQHIQVMVYGDQASITLDCAQGKVDSDFNTHLSKIDADGTIIFGGGIGFSPEMPAMYQAEIKDEKMFLEIFAGGIVHSFELLKNTDGVIYPCLIP